MPKMDKSTKAPVSHEPVYYLIKIGSTITGVVEAMPAHKLEKNQIAISKREYDLMRLLATHGFHTIETHLLLNHILKRLPRGTKAPSSKARKGTKK